jgi:hypothetical protein
MMQDIDISLKQAHSQSPSAYVRVYSDHEAPSTGIGFTMQVEDLEMGRWVGKLESLHRLPGGWNGYDSPAPSGLAIGLARSFISGLLKHASAPSRLAPSAVGGVGVTRRHQGRKVYVEFFNDGQVIALFSDEVSEPRTKRVEPGYRSFQELIGEMRDYLNA